MSEQETQQEGQQQPSAYDVLLSESLRYVDLLASSSRADREVLLHDIASKTVDYDTPERMLFGGLLAHMIDSSLHVADDVITAADQVQP